MQDVAKTLVQVSTALVLMIILELVASMNMTRVQQVHAAMEPLASIMGLVTLVSVHMGIPVSFVNSWCILYRFSNSHDYKITLQSSDATVTVFLTSLFSSPSTSVD
jgi:hypothetical protein